MADCDYCGESFADDESHLRHLRDEHEEELGRIDRQRVARLEDGSNTSARVALALAAAIGVGLLALAAVGVGVPLLGGGGGSDSGGIESASLPEHGNQSLLSDVRTYPSQGRDHVPSGTDIDYARMPPTSGTHYDTSAEAGFYTETPALGHLVHSLEHGAVVVYYDPDRLTPEAEESLRAWAQAHTDRWASVIVAPYPAKAEPSSPYLLTAWRRTLPMEEYDADVVRAFLAEYLGRGPEHPVR